MKRDEEGVRPARWRKAATGLAAVLLLVPIGLWTQRKPIVRDFVDRELKARGVPARYTIDELGLGHQRLTNVVIGDPAAPDLTADMVELHLDYGFGWPTLHGVTARGVRLRGRLVEGAVSLGSLDRLMPVSGGGAFTLPDLDVDLADVGVRLETPAGAVALTVAGQGNLSGGFVGRMTGAAPTLAVGGCTLSRPKAALAVRIVDRAPTLRGPVAAEAATCAGLSIDRLRVDLVAGLAEALEPLSLSATIASGAVVHGAERAAGLNGHIDYDARDARDRHGTTHMVASGVRTRGGTARSLTLAGDYRFGAAVPTRSGSVRPIRFDGALSASGVAIAPELLRGVAGSAGSGGSTPAAPLLTALSDAAVRAGRDADLRTAIGFDGDYVRRASGGGLTGEAHLAQAEVTSRSGARLHFSGGEGARIAVDGGALVVNGTAELGGGGFPDARLRLRQAAAGEPLTGVATVQPYAVGGARLALTPVTFERDGKGALRFATTATIDGPLGDGRVTGLSLPIAGRAAKRLVVNTACVPLRFASLSIAGVTIGASRLPLCPVGGAMLRSSAAGIGGGIAVPGPHLEGRVGSQPLTIAARDLRVAIGTPGFTAAALAVRLGGGDTPTRLDVAQLAGRVDRGGVGGRFAGAGGRIGNVPLLLSGGDGDWRLAGGRLALAGTLTVADADPAPRFNPLTARDVKLELAAGVIHAGGTLREPGSGLAITAVSLTHDLRKGRGEATLDVPGITFGPAFQPEALTRLTFGIVANVVGTVTGAGQIRWSPDGVTSTGDFATDRIDLAAAFGQVSGIATKIHFSDLLGLSTPPGQIATIAAVNPGIAVEGGVVGYQLLPNQQVAVGGGKWPFSGGALILEPTILDFGRPVERRMTFRVEGMQAGAFISQFDFKNIAATGIFDGTLPLIFDEKGGRIVGGRLVVRKGGGTLAYVGELTNKELGTFGKLAFDALKAIRYDNLAVELDGALDSEIVSRIVFTGVNENPAPGKEAKGWLKNLTGLPFKFNIVVRAPFRGLTNAASAFVNPGGLIADAAKPATPAPAVQPPLSEDKR